MKKKKILFYLLLTIIFFFGFMTHALFFPAVLTNNFMFYAKKAVEKKEGKAIIPIVENTNKALTIVTFNEGEFDPQVAVIGRSYYIGIINNSDTELMSLTSSNPLFRTPRGYGKSEQLMVQLYDVGEYTVSSALHPDKVLKVIVK